MELVHRRGSTDAPAVITARTSGAAASLGGDLAVGRGDDEDAGAGIDCSNSANPSACTIVETGTGTAPMRIAAR